MRTDVLRCPHEVVELRKKDRDQFQHGMAYVETRPDSSLFRDGNWWMVNTAKTAEDDLISDVVALVTSFCARLYGRRRAQRKTEHVLAALQQKGSSREPEATIRH
jgi:predicted site-specific integrase-resolvase